MSIINELCREVMNFVRKELIHSEYIVAVTKFTSLAFAVGAVVFAVGATASVGLELDEWYFAFSLGLGLSLLLWTFILVFGVELILWGCRKPKRSQSVLAVLLWLLALSVPIWAQSHNPYIAPIEASFLLIPLCVARFAAHRLARISHLDTLTVGKRRTTSLFWIVVASIVLQLIYFKSKDGMLRLDAIEIDVAFAMAYLAAAVLAAVFPKVAGIVLPKSKLRDLARDLVKAHRSEALFVIMISLVAVIIGGFVWDLIQMGDVQIEGFLGIPIIFVCYGGVVAFGTTCIAASQVSTCKPAHDRL